MVTRVNAAIALLLSSFVYAQAPPTPKYDEVVESKVYPGVTISYKAVPVSGICIFLLQYSQTNYESY
jgi:hypothetical protein